MPNILEIKVEQKKRLYQLLRVKKALGNQTVNELEEFIIATETEMEKEDVAYVEKQIAKL